MVPTPPWWTAAAVRGMSHQCGASSMTQMSSEGAISIPPAPVTTTPRRPARRRPFATMSPRTAGFRPTILPKPTYTGGSPAARKSVRDVGGLQSVGGRRQKPSGRARGGQSDGAGSRVGLQALSVPCLRMWSDSRGG